MKKSKHLSRLVSKPVLIAAALLAVGIAGFGVHRVTAQVVQDCSNNSIIKCGAQTPTEFINKVEANNPADLQDIYSAYTLTPDKYSSFEQTAKMGTAYKNGTIVVDGQTVATDSWSIGREKKPYSTDDVINGHTYYKSYSKDVFAVDSIPAMVYFNDQGNIQFAVLTACGNPMGGTPVVSKNSCDMLQKTAVQGQDNTYQFTTKATVGNGAKVSRVVYDFGDGSATVTQSDAAAAVTHTYSKSGTFTAKVTVFVVNASGNEVSLTAATCQTQITVQQPTPPPVQPVNYACTNLQATVDQNNYLVYTFTANTTANNATLKSADFDFGDGMTAPGIGPVANAPATATVQHTYAKAGTYQVKATVHFAAAAAAQQTTQNGTQVQAGVAVVKDATCATTVTINAPAPVTPAATPPQPTAPLPNAGPAGVAGIFGGASAIGALGYRLRLRRKTNLLDRLIERAHNRE